MNWHSFNCMTYIKAKLKMGNSRSNQYGRALNQHQVLMGVMPQNVKQLHLAVMSNDKETVKTLLEEGVNCNFPWYNPSNPSIKDGSTPLIVAVSLNHTEIIHMLLTAKNVVINKCDGKGCTPIYKASFHGRPSVIEVLCKAGADVNLSDYLGKTPLYMCVNNCIVHSTMGKISVAKLISAGAIVDKRDKAGQAPIHLAAHWKLVEVLNMLLSARSDVNLVDKKGRTPLYICVSSLSTKLYIEDLRHQLPVIITLFNNGADMLNFIEWLHFKGSGLTYNLLSDFKNFESLWAWYQKELTRPQTLKNMCRKVIQKSLSHKGPLVDLLRTIPLPTSLRQLICRRMFYRETPIPIEANHCYTYSNHVK